MFLQLRDPSLLKGRCGTCEFNELCGGCRCRAYAAFDDYLQEDPACLYEPTGKALSVTAFQWSEDAKLRLERIPIKFIRSKVKKGVEAYAKSHSSNYITMDIVDKALAGSQRMPAFIEK